MALTTVKIGTNTTSLITLPHYIANNGVTQITKKRVREKETFNGSLNISTIGNKKKIFTLQYENVKHSDLLIFQNYDQARLWWVEISGFGSTNLFAGACYFQIEENIVPTTAFDDTIIYNFKVYIKQVL